MKHPWPPWRIRSLEQDLDRLASAVRDRGDRSDDDQIWLTRFLVVRACGYVEQVVHETVTAYIDEKSGGTVQAFAQSWLAKSRNPSTANLTDILGRFDADWQKEFEQLLEDDERRLHDGLYALVGRRHQIAHGLNEGLGSRKALELVEVAKDVADWFILRLDPTPNTGRQRSSSS